MSYVDTVICIGPLPILETWPPIYRGREDGKGRIESKPSLLLRLLSIHTLFDWFTFEFIRRPTPLILSPSYWTFVELTLVNACLYTICFVFCYTSWYFYAFSGTNLLTRRHSASSLFSAILCFRKATQEIFSELDKQSRTTYFSRTRVEVQSRDGGGPGPGHTLGQRGPSPGHATRGEPPWSTSWRRPSAYIFP
jgi:hypothetical protein